MKPTILVATTDRMLPVLGGGVARTWSLIRFLRTQGFRVELLASDCGDLNAQVAEQVDRFRCPPRPKNIILHFAQRAFRFVFSRLRRMFSWESVLRRSRRRDLEALVLRTAQEIQPAAVLVTYAWLAPALEGLPTDTLRILDTIDVQHLRGERTRSNAGNLADTRCSREEEIHALNRADALLAIQAEEASELQAMCPGKKVLTVSHAFEVPDTLPASAKGEELLFVGNRYDPNVRGIQAFLKHAWPRIRQARPQARLRVCGNVGQALPHSPEGVDILGAVENLDACYQRAAIVIVPVDYGSGLKIKTVEALAHGKCVVTTPEGVRGMGAPETLPLIIVRASSDMAEPIIDLLGHPEKRWGYEEQAFRHTQEFLAPSVVYQALGEVLPSHRS